MYKKKLTGLEWYEKYEAEVKAIRPILRKQKFKTNGELMMWVMDEIEKAAQRASGL